MPVEAMRALALRDDLGAEERARLVERYRDTIRQAAHDLEVAARMIDGPDPECALLVLADALEELRAGLAEMPPPITRCVAP